MISETLQKARDFEKQYVPRVPVEDRPAFHLTGGIGWINDPNGFSRYKGEYHLFFQYHPYSTLWGPMHWGHVKTKDFIRWERLPVALAPDTEADPDGCFSGSAIELPDGRQLLMYTGVKRVRQEDGALLEYQTQCVAIGDGVDYEKCTENPVISGTDVPDGGSELDFRDPKIWAEDGTYYAVIGNRCNDGSGAILLYKSEDAVRWQFVTVLDASQNEYGRMWECPDFFPLDGKQVLLVSPQEMRPIGLEFHAGYGTVCMIGAYDKENHCFTREQVQAIDYGIDFYAPQTLETYDGRRVMIAWMQNWTTSSSQPHDVYCFGEMTLPRDLSIRNGRLIQNPVRELENYRGRRVAYEDIPINNEEITLPGIRGRFLDLTVSIRPRYDGSYSRFAIKLAMDGERHTTVRYRPHTGTIRVDRSRCGFPHDIVHVREFNVRPRSGKLKIRAILDRHSAEFFFNDGEQAATFVLYTEVNADAISFVAEGFVMMNVEQYELFVKGSEKEAL